MQLKRCAPTPRLWPEILHFGNVCTCTIAARCITPRGKCHLAANRPIEKLMERATLLVLRLCHANVEACLMPFSSGCGVAASRALNPQQIVHGFLDLTDAQNLISVVPVTLFNCIIGFLLSLRHGTIQYLYSASRNHAYSAGFLLLLRLPCCLRKLQLFLLSPTRCLYSYSPQRRYGQCDVEIA